MIDEKMGFYKIEFLEGTTTEEAFDEILK